MSGKILVVDGHPDANRDHLIHALADAYAEGATSAGREIRCLRVAELEFPLLRRSADFEDSAAPPDIAAAQQDILWAEHLVIFYPLWLGTLPALLKGFFEQTIRPGFGFDPAKGPFGPKLKGRSARVVVTMGMPALFYRLFYRAHGLKSLERNILKLCGFGPIHETLFGSVEAASAKTRKGWLAKLERLGREGR